LVSFFFCFFLSVFSSTSLPPSTFLSSFKTEVLVLSRSGHKSRLFVSPHHAQWDKFACLSFQWLTLVVIIYPIYLNNRQRYILYLWVLYCYHCKQRPFP
jgi:hypothetical protein